MVILGLIGIVVVLLVVAGTAFTIARLIKRPVRRLKAALQDAALGDLDFRLSPGCTIR